MSNLPDKTMIASDSIGLVGVGRATEDFLDWLENHLRTPQWAARRTVGLIGLAVAITTAVVAVVIRLIAP